MFDDEYAVKLWYDDKFDMMIIFLFTISKQVLWILWYDDKFDMMNVYLFIISRQVLRFYDMFTSYAMSRCMSLNN